MAPGSRSLVVALLATVPALGALGASVLLVRPVMPEIAQRVVIGSGQASPSETGIGSTATMVPSRTPADPTPTSPLPGSAVPDGPVPTTVPAPASPSALPAPVPSVVVVVPPAPADDDEPETDDDADDDADDGGEDR